MHQIQQQWPWEGVEAGDTALLPEFPRTASITQPTCQVSWSYAKSRWVSPHALPNPWG